MAIFLNKKIIYVPKCNGNRELPIADQIRFDAHAMTGEEEERLTTMYAIVEDSGKRQKKMIVDIQTMATFLSQVDFVHGAYTDEERKNAVTTAKEFAALPGTYEYISEFVAFIKGKLSPDEKEIKN